VRQRSKAKKWILRLTAACASTSRIRPRRASRVVEVLVKIGDALQRKILSTAPPAVRVLAAISERKSSCRRNSDARRSDPAAIERDRIAYVEFVTSVNWADEGKAAQGARNVTQAEEAAYEAASASRRILLVNRGMPAFGVRAMRSAPSRRITA
jgi:hypothetical protein